MLLKLSEETEVVNDKIPILFTTNIVIHTHINKYQILASCTQQYSLQILTVTDRTDQEWHDHDPLHTERKIILLHKT